MINGIIDSNQKIVTNGLVLHLDAAQLRSYPTTGTTWTDLSYNGSTGTLTNGTTYSSINGGVIVFDGLNDYVDCGNILDFDRTDAFSISVWFRVSSLATDEQLVVKMQTGLRGYYMGMEASGQVTIILRNTSGTNQLFVRSTNQQIVSNTWVNICFTYNGNSLPSGIKIYKNGNSVSQTTVSSNLTQSITNSGILGIGARIADGRYYVGSMSVVKIYNKSLTSTEVLQNYNAIKSRFGL